MNAPKRMQIELAKIQRVASCQQRCLFDNDAVADLVEALENGEEPPPVVLFHDGSNWFLADGFYRCASYEAAGRSHIYADVHSGTLRDAILYSCGANASHGKKRSGADITKAVRALLSDSTWGRWPDSRIANACRVTKARVQRIKAEIIEEQEAKAESEPSSTPRASLFAAESEAQKADAGTIAEHATAIRLIAEKHAWAKLERQMEKVLEGCAAAVAEEV